MKGALFKASRPSGPNASAAPGSVFERHVSRVRRDEESNAVGSVRALKSAPRLGKAPSGMTRTSAILPPDFEQRLDVLDAAVEHVRTAVQEAGNGVSLSFQWASGSLGLPQSEGIVAFARRHAIPFDFSPVNRGSHESRLAAYDDLSAYYPLAFDLRSPVFCAATQRADRRSPPVCAKPGGRGDARAASSPRRWPRNSTLTSSRAATA